MNNAWSRVENMKNYEPIRFEYDFDKDPWEPDDKTTEWILDIVGCIDRLYYALSIEEFTEIYNSRKGFHMDVAEARKALSFMYLLTIYGATKMYESDAKDHWNGEDDLDDDLYYLPLKDRRTGKEYITCLSAPDEEDLLDDHIELKDDKPLYIPTPEDAKDIRTAGFPIHNRHVEKAISALQSTFKLSRDKASVIVLDLWASFAWNQEPMDKIKELQDEYKELIPSDIQGIQKLLNIVMELYNHTPQMGNNGYPPAELHERMVKEGKVNMDTPPTIVPMSSMAAEGLRNANIESMGFPVDYNAVAKDMPFWTMQNGNITNQGVKKIYPNDPCPCGSGKKYKKCCGRKGK